MSHDVSAPPPRLRRMRTDDLPCVTAIEAASFPTPWSENMFRAEVDGDAARTHPLVLIVGEAIVGYMVVWHVCDELHLMTIAVDALYRRRGYGAGMLRALVELGTRLGAASIFLEVRVSNTTAQALYRRMGYEVIGRRRGYYPDTGEDALVMRAPVAPAGGRGDIDLGE